MSPGTKATLVGLSAPCLPAALLPRGTGQEDQNLGQTSGFLSTPPPNPVARGTAPLTSILHTLLPSLHYQRRASCKLIPISPPQLWTLSSPLRCVFQVFVWSTSCLSGAGLVPGTHWLTKQSWGIRNVSCIFQQARVLRSSHTHRTQVP